MRIWSLRACYFLWHRYGSLRDADRACAAAQAACSRPPGTWFAQARASGHPRGMGTGGHLIHGLGVAVDARYLRSGGARAAAVMAADAAFSQLLAEHTAVVPEVPPYTGGSAGPAARPAGSCRPCPSACWRPRSHSRRQRSQIPPGGSQSICTSAAGAQPSLRKGSRK